MGSRIRQNLVWLHFGLSRQTLASSATESWAEPTLLVCHTGIDKGVQNVGQQLAGEEAFDAAILRALQNWRYKPHQIGDRAVTVCGMVTFIYEIH